MRAPIIRDDFESDTHFATSSSTLDVRRRARLDPRVFTVIKIINYKQSHKGAPKSK
jgi:hypothetical protein